MTVAEELRLKDDVAGAIAAYVDIVTNFPNEEQPRNALEMMTASLRARASKLSSSDFAMLREPLEKAAALDIVSRRCCSEKCFGKAIRKIPLSG